VKKHRKKATSSESRHVTLKTVAERVGLTKGICSAVLNKSAASRSVPPHTQERILQAARELNYRPSFYARNLGVKRTYMIGVVTQEIGDFYGSPIISGVERYLRQENYSFLHSQSEIILSYWRPIRTFYWIAVWKDSLPSTLSLIGPCHCQQLRSPGTVTWRGLRILCWIIKKPHA
jgi:hypothetical protein